MGTLGSIASGVRQSVSDAAFEMRVLREAGVLGPSRPDRTAKVVSTFLRWGASPATGVAAAAHKYPHETMLIDERGSLSFERVQRRTNALAHAFAAMGIGYGDGIGIMCRNHRGFIEATLAAAKLGASALYLNTMFAGPQLVEVTRRERPKALVYDEEFVGLLDGVDDGIERIVAWTDGAPDEVTLDSLIAANDDSNLKPPPDKPRFVILTSGTTGTPKGAQRSSPDGLLALAALIDRMPFRARETMMVAAPLFHSWGFFHFVMSLPTASTMVLRRRFDEEDTLRAIEEHRAQVLAVVPVMLQRILRLPEETLGAYDLSSLRITSVSGSALPGELATEWMDRFGDTVYNLYGSTEVAYATVASPEDLRAAPGTAGLPPRGTMVRLYDEAGREVPRGEVGRIFVGNEMSFEGYTGGGGKEAIDGLLSSGDVGHLDAAGLLFIDGRDDEMIVSGGENVFPREVEDLLADHAAVVEVAVIGVDDNEFGQRLKAFVVPAGEGEVSEEELRAHIKANLASYKAPREIEFLDELPRNATGKILKRELHAREAQKPAEKRTPLIAVFPLGSRVDRAPVAVVGCLAMGDPATQLRAVGAATEELHETAKQALEWVRVSEERVARAEARADRVHAEIKERAKATLAKLSEEGRERIAAERGKRKQAEARAVRAEEARDRAEKAFEGAQKRTQGDREALAAELGSARADADRALAETVERAEREAARRHGEALDQAKLEADQRVAAAEQRAAEAEAAAAESHELAVRLEAEIEERVMRGTEDVRREAGERVRKLVEKVEGQATEKARARAEEALKAESERIRVQAEQREERVRQAAEEEIKASASRARREAIAAAEETAPAWARRETAASGSGYRTF